MEIAKKMARYKITLSVVHRMFICEVRGPVISLQDEFICLYDQETQCRDHLSDCLKRVGQD